MKRRMLAVGGPGHLPEGVTSVAAALAATLHARVEQHILDTHPSEARAENGCRALVLAAAAEDVVGIVVDRPAGDVDWALRLAARMECPVVFVPRSTAAPFEPKCALVPLDGTSQATEAVSEATRLMRGVGADVVVLHCVHGSSVPRFEDHPQYDPGDWTREFTARYIGAFGEAHLEVRAGRPEDHAIEVSEAVGADLIMLAWNRHPARSRARTVRAILEHSAVPVVLLPTDAAGAQAEGERRPRGLR
jgi:nucleotide-binding universal stress UspA family protein